MTAWLTLLVAIANVYQISASLPPTDGNRGRATTTCYANQTDKYFFFSTKTSGFEIAESDTTPVSVPGWLNLLACSSYSTYSAKIELMVSVYREM